MKKLYFLLFSAIICFNTAQAGINYVSVTESFYDTTRYYDIDNNGVNDFSFVYNGIGSVLVRCETPNAYYAGNIVQEQATAYEFGENMGTFGWADSSGSLENFFGKDNYLMVKLDNGTTAYYGWFRINYVTNSPGIVSYAYNDVADQEITPGQGDPGVSTSISEIKPGNYGFLMTGNNISFKDCSGYDKVCFYNTNGQQLSEITAPVEQQQYSISINGAIIVSFFKNGRVAASTQQYIK